MVTNERTCSASEELVKGHACIPSHVNGLSLLSKILPHVISKDMLLVSCGHAGNPAITQGFALPVFLLIKLHIETLLSSS